MRRRPIIHNQKMITMSYRSNNDLRLTALKWWLVSAVVFMLLFLLTSCDPRVVTELREVVLEKTVTDTIVTEEAIIVWRDTVICPPALTKADTVYRTRTQTIKGDTIIVNRLVRDTVSVPVDKVVERTVVKRERPGIRDYAIIVLACLIVGFGVGRFLRS
jgi:hypothetical protein